MTFAAPLFLIATLAGLIPVVLHMVNRQKAPVMPFGTLRFLRLSVQRTRRRKTVHDMLLLLLRVAALVLLAVALARPTVRYFGNPLGRGRARAIVIVLDNSASMATVDEAGSRWEAALRAAEWLLDQLAADDSVALLVTGGPARHGVERLVRNHEVVRQALDACQASHERADLRTCLRAADKLLKNAEVPNKEIYVITDMQAISWDDPAARHLATDPSNAADGPNGQAGVDAKRDAVPVVVVDVHGRVLPNVALARIELDAAAPVTAVPVEATVTVRGDASTSHQKHVEFHLDGSRRSVSPTLAIDAGKTAQHTFRFSLDEPGVYRGEFRLLGDDACRLDDRRYFAVVMEPHIAVGIVQLRGHEIPYLRDAYYLERALAPIPQGKWAIHSTLLTPTQLLTEPLSKYSAVFCVNLPALDRAAAQRLHAYVVRGGHVVWTCGDRIDPDRYETMNAQLDGQLLPARLTAARVPSPERTDGWRLGWLDDQHPALAPLVEPASLLQSVLVHKCMATAPAEGSDVRVLARLDDGAPLLSELAVGAGSVLLLATSVNVDWTNLPLRPLFLPLVTRLTFHLAGTDTVQTQRVAGTPLIVPLVGASVSAVEVFRPSGATVRLSPSADRPESGRPTVRYADTHEVGVYEVRSVDGEQRRQTAFALNLDPDELDARVLDRKALEARLGRETLLFCGGPAGLARVTDQLRVGESLCGAFLVAVLIALVAEAFVANRRATVGIAERPPRPAGRRGRPRRPQPDVIVIR